MFAQIAPVGGIVGKARNGQFFRIHHQVPDSLFFTKSFGFLQFPFRKRAGPGGNGQHFVPQGIVGHFQEKSGIHPSGKSHRHTAQLPEHALEFFQFVSICRFFHGMVSFLISFLSSYRNRVLKGRLYFLDILLNFLRSLCSILNLYYTMDGRNGTGFLLRSIFPDW